MGAAPVLIITKDGETIKSQPLEGETVLGRSEGCVIRLDDRAISRQHAVFRPTSGGIRVEKKSEFAPLSVNGSECTSAFVKEGDVIAIGPYLLKLSTGGVVSAPIEMAQPEAQSEAQPQAVVLSTPAPAPDNLSSNAPDRLSPDKMSDEAPAVISLDRVPDAAEIKIENSSVSTPALEAPSAELQAESGPAEPEGFHAPDFSLDAKAPEGSAPVDLGEIHVDEDAATKLVSAAKVSAKLVLPPGSANVSEFEIEKEEISIGREKDCDVVLDDKKASRKHAVIRRTGVSFSIKDLDSANGTYVNGSKIQEQGLSGDDIIKIGNVEFRFLVLSADYVRDQQDFMPVMQEPEMDFASVDAVPSQGARSSAHAPSAGEAMGGFPGASGMSGTSGISGISGIAGIGGVTTKKQTLFEKYRALPPRRKAIWTVVIIAALYFAFFDDEVPKVHPKTGRPAAVHTVATFDSLTPEQKKFVESQHALAFDYYKNHEYDKAIFEIDKIFALIPDYKDSREIERYAKEGKRKLEALEEEKHKQEEEAKLKLQIAELVDDAKTLMDQKKYGQVGDLFSQILELDPDNQQVADWRKQVDAYEEQKRIADEQREVQEQINARAWDLYKEGMALKGQKRYGEAIASFRRVAEIGATDKRAERSAVARIKDIQQLIADIRDPVLASAKEAEDSQDYAKAYKLYEKATEIDPSYPDGYAGMDRVRGVLHEQAKALYIEAVLAESYTDFDTAKKKYQACLNVAPKDDIYHDRAERKLAAFFNNDGAAGAASQ